MASYSEPINPASRRNSVLQRKLKAAIDRFIVADDQTKSARKAREESQEYQEAIITIILDTLRTKL